MIQVLLYFTSSYLEDFPILMLAYEQGVNVKSSTILNLF